MCVICDRIAWIKRGGNPYFVREMKTGYVVIGDHQYFHGYTLFLCKEHKTELFYLEDDFCKTYLWEMALVTEAAGRAFGADKMNCELLGNGDAHVHWHLFPRRKDDLVRDGIDYGCQFKGPVWWVPLPVMQGEDTKIGGDALQAMKAALNQALDAVLAEHGITEDDKKDSDGN